MSGTRTHRCLTAAEAEWMQRQAKAYIVGTGEEGGSRECWKAAQANLGQRPQRQREPTALFGSA